MSCNSTEFIAELRQMVEQANSRLASDVPATRHGMPSGDFIAKLRQIEEQANAAIAELPAGMLKTRIQHIVVLAKTLRGRLEFGAMAVRT